MEGLFNEINRLAIKAYIKTGKVIIIDASVIEAKNGHPNKSKVGKSTQDFEGNVHDSHCFTGLLSGDETTVLCRQRLSQQATG